MTPNSTENMAESVETRGSCDNSSSRGSGSFYHTGLWLAYVTRGCQQKLLCTPWAGRKWGRRGGCLFHFSSLRVERMANRFVRVLRPPISGHKVVNTGGWTLTPFTVAVPYLLWLKGHGQGVSPVPSTWGCWEARDKCGHALWQLFISCVRQDALSKMAGFGLFSC